MDFGFKFDFGEILRKQMEEVADHHRREIESAFNPGKLFVERSDEMLRDHLDRQVEALSEGPRGLAEELANHRRQMVESALNPVRDIARMHDDVMREMVNEALTRPRFDHYLLGQSLVAEGLRALRDIMKQSNPVLARAAQVLYQHGWWIIGSLPIAYYAQIANLGDEASAEEITADIVAYFNRKDCAKLEEVINGWTHPIFGAAERLFRPAFMNHRQGMYAAAVAALTPVVEHIVRKVIQEGGQIGYRQMCDRFEAEFHTMENLPEDRELEFRDLRAIVNYHNLQALRAFYGRYDRDRGALPWLLNRHMVAHAISLDYDSMEFSTKLFLFLEMLHSMVEQLTEDDES